jgi:recombination protein RecA
MSSQKPADDPAEQSRLDSTLQNLVRRYGTEVIGRASEIDKATSPSIPTGSFSLDHAIGIGGVPRGRVTEIFGPESCGKTTLALSILAEGQRLGSTAVFIDMEHVLNLPYAARLGVDLDNLILVQPEIGEQAFDIMEALILSGEVDLIVLDSMAALVPRVEAECDMGLDIGDKIPSMIDQAMRKLSGPIAKTNTCVIFTNQLRVKLSVLFGNPEITTGGMPLHHWASVRLDMRRIQSIKVGADVIGSRTRVRVVKNRLGPPFKTAEFDMLFDVGISKHGDMLDLATEHGIITKKGSHYSYGEIQIGQGRMNAVKYLRQNEEFSYEIENKIRLEINKVVDEVKELEDDS